MSLSFARTTDADSNRLQRCSNDLKDIKRVSNLHFGPRPGQWKPFTAKKRFLVVLICVTVLLLGLLLLVEHIQQLRGYVVPTSTNHQLSTWNSFLFKTLPVALIVCYGLAISAIELDIKRIEPYYQLSGTDRVRASESILLKYDVDFVLKVLWDALRLKHWYVFGISMLGLVATMILPAIQSSIFVLGEVGTTENIGIIRSSGLVGIQAQRLTLSTKFLNNMFGALELSQRDPPFTTREYTLTPFLIKDSTSLVPGNTITATTDRIWTEMLCTSPVVSVMDSSLYEPYSIHVDNGMGCRTTIEVGEGAKAGSTKIVSDHYLLSKENCSEGTSFTTWMRPSTSLPVFGDANTTGIFCQTSYWQQSVSATVDAVTRKILSFTPLSPKQPLTNKRFNSTLFETILATGTIPNKIPDRGRLIPGPQLWDIQDMSAPNLLPRLEDKNFDLRPGFVDDTTGFDVQVVPVQQFALAIAPSTAEIYLDPHKLAGLLQAVHQFAFAYAASDSMSSLSSGSEISIGSLTTVSNVLRIVPSFIHVAQSLLSLILIAFGIWTALLPRRPLLLTKNPESIAQTMLISSQIDVQSTFSGLNEISEQDLLPSLSDTRIGFSHGKTQFKLTLLSSEMDSSEVVNRETNDTTNSKEQSRLATRIISTGVMALILAVVVAFSALKVSIDRHGDAIPPFQNAELLQLTFNLLPTAIAAGIGLYIALLCRTMCFLQPMLDLHRGHAFARSTLGVMYSGLLPHFVGWEAIKARHFLLACLGLATCLSTILTVTLSGTISVVDGLVSKTGLAQPVITTDSMEDVNFSTEGFLILSTNASGTTDPPPWTIGNYAFLPLALPSDGGVQYAMSRDGFGTELECTAASDYASEPSNLTYGLEFGPAPNASASFGYTGFRLTMTYDHGNGTKHQCWFQADDMTDDGFATISGFVGSGPAALELSSQMLSVKNNISLVQYDPDQFCRNRILKAWIRGYPAKGYTYVDNTTTNATGPYVNYTATVISCEAQLKTAKFDLVVSANGSIIDHKEHTGSTTYDMPAGTNLSSIFLFTRGVYQDLGVSPAWHNDTLARDQVNNVLKITLNSTKYLDANLPAPDAQQAMKDIYDNFSRLFVANFAIAAGLSRPSDSTNTFNQSTNFSPNMTISVQSWQPAKRVTISPKMLWVSLAILIVDFCAIFAYEIWLPRPFLAQMPFTVASHITLSAGSRAVDDVVVANGDVQELDRRGYKYAYGKYRGEDGRIRVGIERDEFVEKLIPFGRT